MLRAPLVAFLRARSSAQLAHRRRCCTSVPESSLLPAHVARLVARGDALALLRLAKRLVEADPENQVRSAGKVGRLVGGDDQGGKSAPAARDPAADADLDSVRTAAIGLARLCGRLPPDSVARRAVRQTLAAWRLALARCPDHARLRLLLAHCAVKADKGEIANPDSQAADDLLLRETVAHAANSLPLQKLLFCLYNYPLQLAAQLDAQQLAFVCTRLYAAGRFADVHALCAASGGRMNYEDAMLCGFSEYLNTTISKSKSKTTVAGESSEAVARSHIVALIAEGNLAAATRAFVYTPFKSIVCDDYLVRSIVLQTVRRRQLDCTLLVLKKLVAHSVHVAPHIDRMIGLLVGRNAATPPDIWVAFLEQRSAFTMSASVFNEILRGGRNWPTEQHSLALITRVLAAMRSAKVKPDAHTLHSVLCIHSALANAGGGNNLARMGQVINTFISDFGVYPDQRAWKEYLAAFSRAASPDEIAELASLLHSKQPRAGLLVVAVKASLQAHGGLVSPLKILSMIDSRDERIDAYHAIINSLVSRAEYRLAGAAFQSAAREGFGSDARILKSMLYVCERLGDLGRFMRVQDRLHAEYDIAPSPAQLCTAAAAAGNQELFETLSVALGHAGVATPSVAREHMASFYVATGQYEKALRLVAALDRGALSTLSISMWKSYLTSIARHSALVGGDCAKQLHELYVDKIVSATVVRRALRSLTGRNSRGGDLGDALAIVDYFLCRAPRAPSAELTDKALYVVLQRVAEAGDFATLVSVLRKAQARGVLLSGPGGGGDTHQGARFAQNFAILCAGRSRKSGPAMLERLARRAVAAGQLDATGRTLLMGAFQRQGMWEHAWRLWGALRDDEVDAAALATAIDMCGFEGDIQKLGEVWNAAAGGQWPLVDLATETNAWTSLFEALIRNGHAGAALAQFERFLAMGLRPDRKTLRTLWHPKVRASSAHSTRLQAMLDRQHV